MAVLASRKMYDHVAHAIGIAVMQTCFWQLLMLRIPSSLIPGHTGTVLLRAGAATIAIAVVSS